MGGPATREPSTTTSPASSQPASGGLKQTWGLTDPPPLGNSANDSANKFVTDFKTAIEPVNKCLQFTKVNGEKQKHEALVGKRDQKYLEFQRKLEEVNKDASKADVIAGGADLALASRADHVARAILIGAQERAAAMHALLLHGLPTILAAPRAGLR